MDKNFTGCLEDTRTADAKLKDWQKDVALSILIKWEEKEFGSFRTFGIRNQNGGGTCVMQTCDLICGIENFLEEGKFIETVLGMKSLKWRKYKSKEGETLLELYELDDYVNVPTAYNHVAFTTDDIKKIENEFKFFGVPYVISKDTSGTHMVMFCRDFDNNLLEIVEVL